MQRYHKSTHLESFLAQFVLKNPVSYCLWPDFVIDYYCILFVVFHTAL